MKQKTLIILIISIFLLTGCSTKKEAFHQYNKSGDETHASIGKTGNIYA